jgi:hypothetical protein
VDAHALRARHGEHAKGIGAAQVGLGGEGELAQVGQARAVLGPHAGGVELGAVHRRVVAGVAQRRPQPLELQRAQFVDARLLDRLERKCRHAGPSAATTVPWMVALLPRNIATVSPRWLVTFMS